MHKKPNKCIMFVKSNWLASTSGLSEEQHEVVFFFLKDMKSPVCGLKAGRN